MELLGYVVLVVVRAGEFVDVSLESAYKWSDGVDAAFVVFQIWTEELVCLVLFDGPVHVFNAMLRHVGLDEFVFCGGPGYRSAAFVAPFFTCKSWDERVDFF